MKRWSFLALVCTAFAASVASAVPSTRPCFVEALKSKVKIKVSPEAEPSGQYFKLKTSDGLPATFERTAGGKPKLRVIPAEDLIRGADMLHNPIVYRAIARAFKTRRFDPKRPQKSIQLAMETYVGLHDPKLKNVHLENIYGILNAELNDVSLNNLVIAQESAEAVRLKGEDYRAFADITRPLLKDKDVAKLLIDEMISDGAGLSRHVADYAKPHRKPLDAAAIRKRTVKVAKGGAHWLTHSLNMAIAAGVVSGVMQGYFSPLVEPVANQAKAIGHVFVKESPEAARARESEEKANAEFKAAMEAESEHLYRGQRDGRKLSDYEMHGLRFREHLQQKREYQSSKLQSADEYQSKMIDGLNQKMSVSYYGGDTQIKLAVLYDILREVKPGDEVRFQGDIFRIAGIEYTGSRLQFKLEYPRTAHEEEGQRFERVQVEDVSLLSYPSKTIGEALERLLPASYR